MRASILFITRLLRSKDTSIYAPGQQLPVFRRSQSRMTNRGRPGKKDEAPAPLYLQEKAPPYCHTCGRVISKASLEQDNVVKYCSHGCRSRKPGPRDREIEKTIAQILEAKQMVSCADIESVVFGEATEQTSTDIEVAEVEGSKDYHDQETKRQAGQQRAAQREMVRRAARRGVIFGLDQESNGRKCEVVQHGRVVEPSFAKGDFNVRWRT